MSWQRQNRSLSLDNICSARLQAAAAAERSQSGLLWRSIEFSNGIPAGKWLTILLHLNFFESLARPVIRFRRGAGDLEFLMSAPLFGSTAWVGYVPKDAIDVAISSGHLERSCSYEIEVCQLTSWTRILLDFFLRDILSAAHFVWLWLIGLKKYARGRARKTLEETSLARYHEWRSHRIRELNLRGVDQPRMDLQDGPHVKLILEIPTEEAEKAALTTLLSLSEQVYRHWSVIIVSALPNITRMELVEELIKSDRAIYVPDVQSANKVLSNYKSGLVTFISAGDRLPSYSLAIVAEYAAVHPNILIFYGDEESIDKRGLYCDPELKPDWSAIFQRYSNYLGRAVYYRTEIFVRHPNMLTLAFLKEAIQARYMTEFSGGHIGHLRRIVLSKEKSHATDLVRSSARPVESQFECGAPVEESSNTRMEIVASIIIPTKDRADLLTQCLASLRATRPSNFEILIVDNGSSEKATLDLYRSLQTAADLRFVYSPGPFNFSHLCNQGAALARAPILVFLNNDTTAVKTDWLVKLVKWASEPDVGAVGAKLLYPSGRLQHGGVVLGLHGLVHHMNVGASQHEAGYLGRLRVPHEVSAVTGACMAVTKWKFKAVEGFDSKRFPVELNDIDLCLRLSQRGWKTVFTPEAVLIHHESASRGRKKNGEIVYKCEQANFRLRWHAYIRDDPFFHPSFSLQSPRTMLL